MPRKTGRLASHVTVLLCGLVFTTGCRDEEQVRRYQVPKPHLVFQANHVSRSGTGRQSPSQVASPQVAQRILAAVVPRSEDAWFFKIMGEDAAVAAVADVFDQFVRSVRFQDSKQGKPTWRLPDGWIEKPGNSIRLATIELKSGEVPLELTVTTLSLAGDTRQYILSNINRWRDQVGIEPLRAEQLADNVREIDLEGETATIVNLVGTAPVSSKQPPFARRPLADTASAAEPGITYETPEGWQSGSLVSSRGGITIQYKAAFEVQQGEQETQITVSSFPATMANLPANVNRWRTQVGLPEVSGDELQSVMQEIQLGDTLGHYVELIGDEQSIVAVISVLDGQSWFFKMMGQTELTTNQRENFQDFVRSVKYSSS